ncbi:flagellar filament capping protein FliD [Polynucleobacter sp. JS-Mosq-20-D10]|uniref:flagellar filament capping protein FliD n=1 Tax=Polynucleobacter sp. JS-Mosq-20-D10 TaxID=2576922 RepID=UPI001BFD069B|nr:flagellar filament capping protein FliD [Polynucleobacter sp. JS-Mosq-20-D10]QWE00884.1 flagellar filament capping protein FliD [Polynucleobacter sp. JS-Mosq-20-D10]
MAVSSTSSSTNSTTSIDVPSIVSQLMVAENKPLVSLKEKITSKSLMISDLGMLKGKVATFQTALQSLQTPSALSSAVASSSDESVVRITSSADAIKGQHDIIVSQVAKPAQITFNQFASSTANAGLAAGDTFSITVGTRPYTYPPAGVAPESATIEDLKNWVNNLGDNLSASVVQTTESNYALKIQGTEPGSDNAISYSHMSAGVSVSGLGSPAVAPSVINAQDASFTLDGQVYERKSNTITDALSGVTINLIKSDAGKTHTIGVDKGEDTALQVMQGLVDAFNDLVLTAKKLSAKSSPSSTSSSNGSLANSPTALSFMKQIKTMLAGDIHYSLAGTAGTLSMGDLGFEMQFDGTAKFNAKAFNSSLSAKDPVTDVITSKNKSAILASGIKVGYATYVIRDPVTGVEISKNTTDVTLDSYLTSLLKTSTVTVGGVTETVGGAFDRQIKNEQSSLAEMNKKQVALQMRLDEKQKTYYSQYSALNALLFKLSNTSDSLTNALNGLTNGQNNK